MGALPAACLILLCLGAAQAWPVSTEGQPHPKSVPQLPRTLMVLGRELTLKSQESSPSEDLVAEYVPAAETLDHWTLMLAVRIFKARLAPDKAVGMKEQEIAARRAQGDFMANSMSFAKGDVRVIDFVLSESPIVEHNLMSFRTRRDGRLASYQLARRYYQPTPEVDDGLRAFMGEIKSKRDAYLEELDRATTSLEGSR